MLHTLPNDIQNGILIEPPVMGITVGGNVTPPPSYEGAMKMPQKDQQPQNTQRCGHETTRTNGTTPSTAPHYKL